MIRYGRRKPYNNRLIHWIDGANEAFMGDERSPS